MIGLTALLLHFAVALMRVLGGCARVCVCMCELQALFCFVPLFALQLSPSGGENVYGRQYTRSDTKHTNTDTETHEASTTRNCLNILSKVIFFTLLRYLMF